MHRMNICGSFYDSQWDCAGGNIFLVMNGCHFGLSVFLSASGVKWKGYLIYFGFDF